MTGRRTEIRAEMVASVAEVLAEPGALLRAGDTVVVLESMKMDIPVLAEAAGVLRELVVVVGQVVVEGDLIAVIDEG